MTEALRTLHGVARGEAPPAARRARCARSASTDGERRLRQYPHELSGGLLQRVMIATTLLAEPRLVLADEPTTALDVTTQAEVMAILDELRRERGLALLFITHDLELAAAVCDRTAVHVRRPDRRDERRRPLLHGDPLHPYTAALAGGAARTSRRPRTGSPRSPAGRSRRSRRRDGLRVRAALRARAGRAAARRGRRSSRSTAAQVRCRARARAARAAWPRWSPAASEATRA